MSLTRNVVRGAVTRAVTWGLSDSAFYGGFSPTLHYNWGAGAPTIMSLAAVTGPTLSLTRATTAKVTDWENVIRVTKSRYLPMPYVSMGYHEQKWPDFRTFHWENFMTDVKADLDYINNYTD